MLSALSYTSLDAQPGGKQMKTILGFAAILLFSLVGVDDSFARGGGGRPYYGGGKHTKSHGGDYVGGQGSSHKGGKYTNPSSGDRYGIHK
jgi:hypothetical protein